IDPHWARYLPPGLPALGLEDRQVGGVLSALPFTGSSKTSNRTFSLPERLASWNQITQALVEKSRN
ncbi:MAG: hypothetical protein WB781_27530, partial [Candidatus Sulfotelmatobacter sp.]